MTAMYFDDFKVGDEFVTPARTIAEADVVNFAGLSGDFNPLHTDEEFGKETIFGGRIAHGLLGLVVTSGLKQRLGFSDGTVIAFLGLTWNFKGPIRFGDTVRVRLRIAEMRPTSKPDRGVIKHAVELVNQRGEVVQDGEHVLMVRRRPQATTE